MDREWTNNSLSQMQKKTKKKTLCGKEGIPLKYPKLSKNKVIMLKNHFGAKVKVPLMNAT